MTNNLECVIGRRKCEIVVAEHSPRGSRQPPMAYSHSYPVNPEQNLLDPASNNKKGKKTAKMRRKCTPKMHPSLKPTRFVTRWNIEPEEERLQTAYGGEPKP